MPHNRSVSPRREPRELAGRMGASRGALSSAKAVMAEEEMAALFRNNLLRSCWKPGLSAEAVQHVLTIWEIKLVEVLHRWVHPEKWEGLKRWKRMWRLRSGRLRDMVRLTAPSTLPRPPALPPSYPPPPPPPLPRPRHPSSLPPHTSSVSSSPRFPLLRFYPSPSLHLPPPLTPPSSLRLTLLTCHTLLRARPVTTAPRRHPLLAAAARRCLLPAAAAAHSPPARCYPPSPSHRRHRYLAAPRSSSAPSA